MHFFVWLLILLLIVLMAGLALAIVYLTGSKSNQQLLDEITFSKIDTSLSNGVDTLWDTQPPNQKAVLAKLQDIRTFLALSDWLGSPTITDPSLPLYFTLPEAAVSVKTYIAGQVGITYPGSTDDLKGVLLSPRHVAFKFAQGSTVTSTYLTGAAVAAPLEFGVIIIYTIS
jgi:hypothetical protein